MDMENLLYRNFSCTCIITFLETGNKRGNEDDKRSSEKTDLAWRNTTVPAGRFFLLEFRGGRKHSRA